MNLYMLGHGYIYDERPNAEHVRGYVEGYEVIRTVSARPRTPRDFPVTVYLTVR